MSMFVDTLEARAIGDRKWRLTQPLTYVSTLAHTTIVVPTGFETDGLSTWGIPIISELFDGDVPEAGALHDWLYTCHRFSRAESDDILHEACVTLGMSGWRAWVIWAGVRLGGRSHY